MYQRSLIQKRLIELGQAGEFKAVSYDADTDVPDLVLSSDPNIPPSSIHCNEVNASFAIDPRHGRGHQGRRTDWLFDLRMSWSVEVSLEAFEQAVLDDPPQVAATSDSKQVTLHLVTSEYEHPVTQQPSHGTKAVLTFQARPGRN